MFMSERQKDKLNIIHNDSTETDPEYARHYCEQFIIYHTVCTFISILKAKIESSTDPMKF